MLVPNLMYTRLTEKTVMQGTNQDPIFLELVNIPDAQPKVDNIGKLVEDVEHYKEIMRKMKNTLVKERGLGG